LKVLPAVAGSKFPVEFEGNWADPQSGKLLRLRPQVAVIPLYHKVRVTFLDVQVWLLRLHSVLSLLFARDPKVEWDVTLVMSNDYKARVKRSGAISTSIAEQLLLRSHPRFIWKATLKYNDTEILELLSDATDMARSLPVYEVVPLNIQFEMALRDYLQAPQLQALLSDALTPRFLRLLLDKLGASASA